MKTPRDLLFHRHEPAAPKLDALRRAVIAGHCAPTETSQLASLGLATKLWLELIFPCRRIWTTLAAVWLLVLIANFAQRDDSSALASKAQPSAEMLLAFRSQQKMFNQILSDHPQPVEADRPRNFTPSPRTENSRATTVLFLLPRPVGRENSPSQTSRIEAMNRAPSADELQKRSQMVPPLLGERAGVRAGVQLKSCCTVHGEGDPDELSPNAESCNRKLEAI